MRRPLKIVLFAATVLSPLYGQDGSSAASLPPAMQSAINRLIKGPSPEDRPLLLPSRSTAAALLSQAETCSVPLLEMRVNGPEQFTVRTVPPPATEDHMRIARAPAPPCPSGPRP